MGVDPIEAAIQVTLQKSHDLLKATHKAVAQNRYMSPCQTRDPGPEAPEREPNEPGSREQASD